jgi:hypothetical protein
VDFEWPDQPEQIDEFEKELKQAMERHHTSMMWWQRLAASLLVGAVIAGGFGWRQIEDRRKGEEAKQQVLTALRVTNQVLKNMNRKLAEHDRAESSK